MYTTKVELPLYPFKISHSKRGLLLGSCFAQEIGALMSAAKLPVTINPHGIMFNPSSIARSFADLNTGVHYTAAELVHDRGLWHSMQHHGSFSGTSPEVVLERLNSIEPLAEFDYLIVTLGTAWVYEYRGQVVANCRRLPASEFVRRPMSVDECVSSLGTLAKCGKPVIVTVSPIRHLKDGLAENSLSKSILRVAAALTASSYDNVHYFPSFEILVDELRDYRYYAPDMLHPSSVAVEYIWQRFSSAFFDSRTQRLIEDVSKLQSAFSHRPLHVDSAEYQQFRHRTIEQARQLMAANPELDFGAELSGF